MPGFAAEGTDDLAVDGRPELRVGPGVALGAHHVSPASWPTNSTLPGGAVDVETLVEPGGMGGGEDPSFLDRGQHAVRQRQQGDAGVLDVAQPRQKPVLARATTSVTSLPATQRTMS